MFIVSTFITNDENWYAINMQTQIIICQFKEEIFLPHSVNIAKSNELNEKENEN